MNPDMWYELVRLTGRVQRVFGCEHVRSDGTGALHLKQDLLIKDVLLLKLVCRN
jgi:hypothetical protein